MGLFYLHRSTASAPGGAWWDAHARHDFDRVCDLVAGNWRLRIAGKLNGLGPHVHRRENGEFAACTGIFFYKNYRLETGLERLLDDYQGDAFPWRECRGHYAVIVYKRGRLWLATDELGAYKVYRDHSATRISSSFNALCASFESVHADEQGVYEYAFSGATYGEKTFLKEVRQQRQGTVYRFRDVAELVETAPALAMAADPVFPTVDAAAEEYAARLRALFKTYVGGGGHFHTALSGGYDSRLILALLLDAGVSPTLYVYGDREDADVQVARAVAAGESLPLVRVDKSEQDWVQRNFEFTVERAWARFDGWKNDGLFDNGADAEDRLKRVPKDVSVLNGSAGEVFRNFFYLPDRSYRPEELVWSFYSRFDVEELTHRFEAADYTAAMVADMSLSLSESVLRRDFTRADVEALYFLHRARYWTGRDVGINQRFGALLFPFMEPAVIAGTERIPIAFKEYGRLESLIMQRIHPRLCRYRTTYGFAPAEGPPLGYRARMQLSLRRPPWLRRYSYLIQRRLRPLKLVIPVWLHKSILAAGLRPELPRMAEYFRIERIRDLELYNRLATMELALQNSYGKRLRSHESWD